MLLEEQVVSRDGNTTNGEKHANPVPHKIKYSEDSGVCPALNYKPWRKESYIMHRTPRAALLAY